MNENTIAARAGSIPSGVRPALRVGSEALRRCGHEPSQVKSGGGSDANALLARGYEAVLLANGTEANHTPEESVTASAMVEMLAVCEAAIELAGEASAE